MSTQDDTGIWFDISNEQQNFHLLELPPSLLPLVASSNPPRYVLILDVCNSQDEGSTDMSESLWLKSAEPPSSTIGSKRSSPSAVLCTDDHTYQLRQVQSSNSVFILQPSERRCRDSEIASPGLIAIAQCTATLGLLPSDAAASIAMVSQLLKKCLLPYQGTETNVGIEPNTASSGKRKALQDRLVLTWMLTSNLGKHKDRNSILQDAPCSTEQFEKTWNQLCAFDVLGRAWLPTPSALAMVWKSILSATTFSGVNFEQRFDVRPIAEMVADDGYPWALFIAVLTRLVSETDDLKDHCKTRKAPAPLLMSDTIPKGIILSRDKTVQWVGLICLQRAGEFEQDNTHGIPQSDFLAQWRDLLPEDWRRHASMDLLKV